MPQKKIVTTDFYDRICYLLEEGLTMTDLDLIIPQKDALRAWWSPTKENLRMKELLEVIRGSNDYLSLAALVQFARLKVMISPALDKELAFVLMQSSISYRNSASSNKSSFHVFVSYSHQDTSRVQPILSILKEGGLRIFRDVEQILPGESIVSRLRQIMSTVPRALLIVSKNYLSSDWTSKELNIFLERSSEGGLRILPVLIDDVPLPDSLKDIFTIDLRGFQDDSDSGWAQKRLQKIIDVCLATAHASQPGK